jgi:hypothetical protein
MKFAALLSISLSFLASQEPAATVTAPATLLSSSRVEGLSEEARVILATDYILNLEPGIKADKGSDALVLSTYDGAKVRVAADNEIITLPSPMIARLTPQGWDLGIGKVYPSSALRVSRDVQDDTDSNLKSMQESAKKLKAKSDATPPKSKQKSRVRWLYGQNPFPTAEPFNTVAIQQLTHLSAIGF